MRDVTSTRCPGSRPRTYARTRTATRTPCPTGFSKRAVYCATKAYSLLTDELRDRVSARVFDLIVHTDNRAKMTGLEAWVRTAVGELRTAGYTHHELRCTLEGAT